MQIATPSTPELAVSQTVAWLQEMVIGLNLCPFARAEHLGKRIRYVVHAGADEAALLQTLEDELLQLQATPPAQVETTLIICPELWPEFLDFHIFQASANSLLKRLGLRGSLQIASFHPRYVFAGCADDELGNFSNRSPHPTLHLIREDAIARAAASMDDPDAIYQANIALLQGMGQDAIAKRLAAAGHRPSAQTL